MSLLFFFTYKAKYLMEIMCKRKKKNLLIFVNIFSLYSKSIFSIISLANLKIAKIFEPNL